MLHLFASKIEIASFWMRKHWFLKNAWPWFPRVWRCQSCPAKLKTTCATEHPNLLKRAFLHIAKHQRDKKKVQCKFPQKTSWTKSLKNCQFFLFPILTCISLVVYCCTLIHRKVLMLFRNPWPPVPPPCRNFTPTKPTISCQGNTMDTPVEAGVRASTEKKMK